MFNGILIFVQCECTSFSLELSSLVQSSKNHFSWYTAVFCSSLQHMTIFTKVCSQRLHIAFLAAFSVHCYMSVQTCPEHFFSPHPEISWWPPASGSCHAWNVHWPPSAGPHDPPAKQQKPASDRKPPGKASSRTTHHDSEASSHWPTYQQSKILTSPKTPLENSSTDRICPQETRNS